MVTVTIDRRRGEDGWGAAAAAPTPPLSPFGAAVSSSVGSVTGGCVPLGLSNIVVATPAPSPSPLAASVAKLSATAALAASSASERYAATSHVSAAGSNANDADYGLQRAFMAQPRVCHYFSIFTIQIQFRNSVFEKWNQLLPSVYQKRVRNASETRQKRVRNVLEMG